MLPNYYLWGGVYRHYCGTISWIFGEPDKVMLDGAFNFRESESMRKTPVGDIFRW